MEDRSLRKILVQGDRGSNLAKGFSFQSRIYFAKRIDGNPQLSDVLHQTHATLIDREAVATSLLCKEERSLENWSYDVTCLEIGRDDIIHILLCNTTNESSNFSPIISTYNG